MASGYLALIALCCCIKGVSPEDFAIGANVKEKRSPPTPQGGIKFQIVSRIEISILEEEVEINGLRPKNFFCFLFF